MIHEDQPKYEGWSFSRTSGLPP